MEQRFDDVVREFIDFVNDQIGMYMDCMAGFEGIKVKLERQVSRVRRPTSKATGDDGVPVITWSSYEDPESPDVIHTRILKADDYIRINSTGEANEQQLSQSVIVFLFTYWEETVRPKLAASLNVEKTEIKADVMGDLRIIRHAILHAKGVLAVKEHRRLKYLNEIFLPGEQIILSYDIMHKIFYMAKQDAARLMYEWLGEDDPLIKPEDIRGIALMRGGKPT